MGRRHDWTLRPELMRRKAVPVGNWPTVADIPPGVPVLDSDGVVKVKGYNGELCYIDPLTDAYGNMILIDGMPITQIPYGTKIQLNADGSISINKDGFIAIGV